MVGRREQALALAELRILNKYNASLGGMAIDGPVFRFEGHEYPINSVTAQVKRGDTSTVYMSLRLGDGTVRTISKPVSDEPRLRAFADKLESAANRRWPIKTPFGTELRLDPNSKPVVEQEPVTPLAYLGIGLLGTGVVLSAAGFVLSGWVLFVGVVMLVLSLVVFGVFLYQNGLEYERDLDRYFPDWRDKEQEAKSAEQRQIWDRAREKGQGQDPKGAQPRD